MILEVFLRISIGRSALLVDEGVCGSVFIDQNALNLSRCPSNSTCAISTFWGIPTWASVLLFFVVEVCDVIHDATTQSKTAPLCTANALARHHSWPLPRLQGNARALCSAHLCATQKPRRRSSHCRSMHGRAKLLRHESLKGNPTNMRSRHYVACLRPLELRENSIFPWLTSLFFTPDRQAKAFRARAPSAYTCVVFLMR